MKKLLIALAAMALVAGCTKKEEAPGVTATNQPAANAPAAAGAAQGETKIDIGTVGEQMAFDKTDLTVPAGKDITLTLKNNSTTLKHNWVLTNPGKDNDVGLAGIKAGEAKQFIPDSPDVLAHTKLLDPGASDTITFKAPPAGDYPFICTNAGHHTVMKGVLHSK